MIWCKYLVAFLHLFSILLKWRHQTGGWDNWLRGSCGGLLEWNLGDHLWWILVNSRCECSLQTTGTFKHWYEKKRHFSDIAGRMFYSLWVQRPITLGLACKVSGMHVNSIQPASFHSWSHSVWYNYKFYFVVSDHKSVTVDQTFCYLKQWPFVTFQ